jgi:hypothetical protein
VVDDERASAGTSANGDGAAALPVPVQTSEVRPIEPAGGELARPLAAQLAAPVVAAAGGFLIGVAAFVLVRVLGRREPVRLRRARARRRRTDVVASRSFLVDVHLLRR